MTKWTILISTLVGILLTFLVNGCSDLTYSRTVTGKVVKTGTRLKLSKKGGQEKISIRLHPYKLEAGDEALKETAGGPSGLVVECLSTRCASLSPGMCIRFDCKHVVNWFEPDIVQCKMDKEIRCSEGLNTVPAEG